MTRQSPGRSTATCLGIETTHTEEIRRKYHCASYPGVFLKWGVPQKGWFMMENSIDMDDFGVPHGTLFQDPPISYPTFQTFLFKTPFRPP